VFCYPSLLSHVLLSLPPLLCFAIPPPSPIFCSPSLIFRVKTGERGKREQNAEEEGGKQNTGEEGGKAKQEKREGEQDTGEKGDTKTREMKEGYQDIGDEGGIAKQRR
jgi:hypothetical protein